MLLHLQKHSKVGSLVKSTFLFSESCPASLGLSIKWALAFIQFCPFVTFLESSFKWLLLICYLRILWVFAETFHHFVTLYHAFLHLFNRFFDLQRRGISEMLEAILDAWLLHLLLSWWTTFLRGGGLMMLTPFVEQSHSITNERLESALQCFEFGLLWH